MTGPAKFIPPQITNTLITMFLARGPSLSEHHGLGSNSFDSLGEKLDIKNHSLVTRKKRKHEKFEEEGTARASRGFVFLSFSVRWQGVRDVPVIGVLVSHSLRPIT